MKRITIFILAVSSLMFACKKDAVQTVKEKSKPTVEELYSKYVSGVKNAGMVAGNLANPADLSKASNGNQVTRKYKSSDVLSFTVDPAGCGGIGQGIVSGPGKSTHMGGTKVRATFCLDGVSVPEGTVTAANGDQLFIKLVFSGIQTPDMPYPGLPYDDFIWTGGTGRFKNASGGIRSIYSVFDLENNILILSSTGTVTY